MQSNWKLWTVNTPNFSIIVLRVWILLKRNKTFIASHPQKSEPYSENFSTSYCVRRRTWSINMSIVYSTKERDWRVSSKTNRATVEQTKIHNNAQMGPIAPLALPTLSHSLFFSPINTYTPRRVSIEPSLAMMQNEINVHIWLPHSITRVWLRGERASEKITIIFLHNKDSSVVSPFITHQPTHTHEQTVNTRAQKGFTSLVHSSFFLSPSPRPRLRCVHVNNKSYDGQMIIFFVPTLFFGRCAFFSSLGSLNR